MCGGTGRQTLQRPGLSPSPYTEPDMLNQCANNTLLVQMDVLAGRTQQNSSYQVEGTVTVNGAPPEPLRFRQSIAYVTQEDFLPVTETVCSYH